MIRKLASTATDPHYDSLQFIDSAGGWSKDGRLFVQSALRKGKGALFIVEPETGRKVHEVEFKEISQVDNPIFTPDGEDRLLGLAGRAARPVGVRPRVEGAEAADARRLRRAAPGGLARRQDDRLHHRPLHDDARHASTSATTASASSTSRPEPSARCRATRRRATSTRSGRRTAARSSSSPTSTARPTSTASISPRASCGQVTQLRTGVTGITPAQPVALRRRGLGPHRVHRARRRRPLHLRDRRPGEAGRASPSPPDGTALARGSAPAAPAGTAADARARAAAGRGRTVRRAACRLRARRRRRHPAASRSRRSRSRVSRAPSPDSRHGSRRTRRRHWRHPGRVAPAPARHGPRREQGREDARGPDERPAAGRCGQGARRIRTSRR